MTNIIYTGSILREGIKDKNFIRIITYPNIDQKEAEERIRYLYNLGIDEILLVGNTSIGKYNLLGKGNNSIVLLAKFKGKKVALKILRLDAQRETMLHEADILKRVNRLGIGPKIYHSTSWLIVEEYIEGDTITKFITLKLMEKKVNLICKVIIDLLEQCYSLDMEGIDHGELSRCHKHIIVTKDNIPVIIDFESASTQRKAKNVTSIVQCIMKRLPISKLIICGITKIGYSYEYLTRLLSEYKRNKNKEIFKHIVEIITNSILSVTKI